MKEILKGYRENNNYTIEEISHYLGKDEEQIISWENGMSQPSISDCIILCNLYGVSLDELFSDFDVKTALPKDCVDSFEHQVMINRMSSRWFN